MTTTRAEYLARWSALHGGYDPASSRLVSAWLALVHRCARPVAAAGVAPWVVTLLGLAVSAAAVPVAWAGGAWLYAAGLLVVVSGLLDGLDGGVALLTGRESAVGYVLDSFVDRCSDLLYLLALWVAGAPAGVCVAAGVLVLLQEYLRARAVVAGMTGIGVVTVFERPARVVVTALALVAAPLLADAVRAGAWAWVVLGSVGLVQLSVVVGRRLRHEPSPG